VVRNSKRGLKHNLHAKKLKLIDIETKSVKKPAMFHPDGCYRTSGHCDCAGDGHYVCTVCARHGVSP
jgi:hypothetical protein